MKSFKSIERMFSPGQITYVISRPDPRALLDRDEVPGAGEKILLDGVITRIESVAPVRDNQSRWVPTILFIVLVPDTQPLKCPNCSCPASSTDNAFVYRGRAESGEPRHAVECSECGLSGPHGTGDTDGDHDGAKMRAVRFWNALPRRDAK